MTPRILLVLAALGTAVPALAADWTMIVQDRTRRIEIDRDSVLQSDPGTKVAWGRIVLSNDDAEEAGYATVKALNRYDCRSRSFSTIKRVYLDGVSRVIREERVAEQRAIEVNSNSVDESLWREVCKPPAARDLARLADEASRVATANSDTPAVRHADLPDAPEAQAAAQRTADTHGAPPSTDTAHAAPGADAHGSAAHVDTKGSIVLPPKPSFALPPRPTRAPTPPTEPAHAAAPAQAAPAAPAHVAPPARKAVVKRATHKPARKKARRETLKVAMNTHAQEPVPPMVAAHKDIHWSYEGAGAPARWGALNPAWKTCDSGKRQSPIDIRDGIRVDLEPIKFDYVPTYFRINNNGHTVKIGVGPGSTMTVMGRTFDLIQFHFHRPSEERINGRGFDMVAHLVHKDLDGRLAVVAVLIERGEAHPLVQTLWNNLPLEQHHDYAPDVAIEPAQMLPAGREYYTYMGSLTTPPCSEDVLWMVMKQPVQLSSEQIAIFSRLYPMNARPVQPANDRLIKASR